MNKRPFNFPKPIYCGTNCQKFLQLRRFVPICIREESYGERFWHSKGFAHQAVASISDENFIEQSPRREKGHGGSSSFSREKSTSSLIVLVSVVSRLSSMTLRPLILSNFPVS
jgi:hypothetical protein